MGRAYSKILILIFVAWLTSCKKDKPDSHPLPAIAPDNVFVVCEGSYGTGNASLYSIPKTRDTAYGDLYKPANGQAIGDVFQSIMKIGEKLYLCINNSDKVLVLNASDLKLAATINVPKPRYILPVSADKAYVSSIYHNKVYVINPQTNTLTDSITLPYQNTEGMCLYNGTAFICTWDTACNTLYKINASSNKLLQSIKIDGYALQAALLDKEQMLWVLAGNKIKSKTATLTRIDPFTGNVLNTYHFPPDADPLKPVFNITKDTLYYVEVNYTGSAANNGIYRIGIHEAGLPATPFIPAAQYQYFWALGIEPATGNIYVGDPVGFTQKGKVMIYRQNGSVIRSFDVGIGPGSFYFGN